MRHCTWLLAMGVLLGPLLVAPTLATEPATGQTQPAGEAAKEGQSLGQAADDPTASLMSVQVSDWYTAGFKDVDGEDANAVVLRSAIPFQTGELNHIFRATVPFITDSPFLDSGLSDMTLFDLVVFDQSWGRWGVGPVALVPTGGSDRGAEQWAAGPAIGFTAREGKLLWGLFNQNLFTYAGDDSRNPVNVSVLQPIISYGLGDGWSTGCSEMTFTYDYEESRWASVPLGVKIAKLTKFGKVPVQLSLQYEHDFADYQGAPEDTIRVAMKFLFPTR